MTKTRDLALTALSAAFVTVATMVIRVPTPLTRGYINLGDIAVVAVAMVLGRRLGWVAGGLGSALADMLGGYMQWAPWTLMIKGLEAYVVSRGDARARFHWTWMVGPLIMVAGYFLVEVFMYGWPSAVAELPGNSMQALSAMVFGPILGKALSTALEGVKA